MRFCAFSTENTRMALNRGNERLPCLQPKIRSGNGRSVFSRSGIVRSRARFTQLTNHYGGAWNLCTLCSSLWNTCFESDAERWWLMGGAAKSGKEECLFVRTLSATRDVQSSQSKCYYFVKRYIKFVLRNVIWYNI